MSDKFTIQFTDKGVLEIDIAYLIQQLPEEQQIELAKTYSWESVIWAELCRGVLEEYSGENMNGRINELRKLILTSPEAPDIFRRILEDLMYQLLISREQVQWYTKRVGALQHWAEEHLRSAHDLRFGEMPAEVGDQGRPSYPGQGEPRQQADILLEQFGLTEAQLAKMKEDAYDKIMAGWEAFKSREGNVKDGVLVAPFRHYPIGFLASEIDFALQYYRFNKPKPPKVVPAEAIAKAIECPPGGDNYADLVARLKGLIA